MPTSGAELPPPEHGLRWGLKASLIAYVRTLPDGYVRAERGARDDGSGQFVFQPESTGTQPQGGGSAHRFWSFNGEVHLGGHFGMLMVQLTSPTIFYSGETGVAALEFGVVSRSSEVSRILFATMPMQEVRAAGPIEVWTSADVRLTAQGASLFNGAYAEGERLSPLSLAFPESQH